MKRKDEDIVFLRSMLASLSEKVDQLEKTAIGRIGEGEMTSGGMGGSLSEVWFTIRLLLLKLGIAR